MASASGNSKSSNSRKLKDTLGELESALTSWDQIIPAPESAEPTTAKARSQNSGVPEEMKRRTRELLNQLKEQIEDLSSEP